MKQLLLNLAFLALIPSCGALGSAPGSELNLVHGGELEVKHGFESCVLDSFCDYLDT